MRQILIICGLLFLTVALSARNGNSQSTAVTEDTARYRLSIPVDEVSLSFHAADDHGLPVNDLRLDELSLFDNGKPPRRLLSFQSLDDFPIRAGFLLDTSESMEDYLPRNRAISIEYAQRLLRQRTDQAFVMDFNFLSEIAQPWTNDPTKLTVGVHKFTRYGQSRIGGTAILTAVYQACLNQFNRIDHATSGNVILLFSDGEDNASHVSLRQAVDMCQHANTAIYAFRVDSKYSFASGANTLRDLASQTGGRVFFADDPESVITDDLRVIEADLRDQYRLVYKPADLKHDGSFHRIELRPPPRANNIVIRSGYYAPAH